MRRYQKYVVLPLVASARLACAQVGPKDVPAGHWAYAAIQDLATHGLILGYPDGSFLGSRALTRYEMAALVQRIADLLDRRVNQRIAVAAPPGPPPPPPPSVTPTELDEVRKLVDEFKVEMAVMGTDLERVKADIASLQELRGQITTLKSDVAAQGKKVTALDKDVADLKKRVGIGGYIQARYESLANASGIYKPGAKPNGAFFVRRGRLKFTSTGDRSDFVFLLDASGNNAFSLKDAYVTWKLSPPEKGVQQQQFWFGQFNVPFGYEVERSDSINEFTERSIAENALFPGERDRGIRYVRGFGPKAWFDASILNGSGINLPFTDDNFKDFTARIKGSPRKDWSLGVSGYWGRAQVPGLAAVGATPGTLVYNKDTNMDGKIDQNDTPSFLPGKAAVAALPGFRAKRDRVGADTQIALLGGTARWEGYLGRQPNGSGAAKADSPISGWYGTYLHPVTKADLLGLRFDTYDANRDAAGSTSSRWNAVWNHSISTNLKLTLGYEWFPVVPSGFISTNKWTFQAQTAF